MHPSSLNLMDRRFLHTVYNLPNESGLQCIPGSCAVYCFSDHFIICIICRRIIPGAMLVVLTPAQLVGFGGSVDV